MVPLARWTLAANDAQDQGIAWDWSRQRVILVALGKVTMYLGERYWRQIGGGVKTFVVPHPPPSVIETEGVTTLRNEGTDASEFLDWTRDYLEWWVTQICGPLGGPVEPPVSLFLSF